MGLFSNLFRPGGVGLTETAIARALVAKGLTDTQGRAAIGSAASVAAGLRAIGLTVTADTPVVAVLSARVLTLSDGTPLQLSDNTYLELAA